MLISDWADWLQALAAMWLILLTLVVPMLVWYVWDLRQGMATLRGEFHRWTLDLVKKELGVTGNGGRENYAVNTLEIARQFKQAGADLITAGGDFDLVTNEAGLHPRVYPRAGENDSHGADAEKVLAEDRDAGIPAEQHEEFLWLPDAWNGERHAQLSEVYLPTRHRKPVPRPQSRYDPEIGYANGHDDTALWHVGPGRLYPDGGEDEELDIGPHGVDPSGRGPYGRPGSASDSRGDGFSGGDDSDSSGNDQGHR